MAQGCLRDACSSQRPCGQPTCRRRPRPGRSALLITLAKSLGLLWVGTVSHLADGDSVESEAWFQSYRVRIRGIDAPEYWLWLRGMWAWAQVVD